MTKVLTIHHPATPTPDDFCWGIEGEIAAPMLVCDCPDCGCDRAWGGLNSHHASTTLLVRTIDIDFDDIVTACIGFLHAAGWADLSTPEDNDQLGRDMAADTTEIAADYPDGTMLRPTYDRDTEQWQCITDG